MKKGGISRTNRKNDVTRLAAREEVSGRTQPGLAEEAAQALEEGGETKHLGLQIDAQPCGRPTELRIAPGAMPSVTMQAQERTHGA
jgi:hypothetical protein